MEEADATGMNAGDGEFVSVNLRRGKLATGDFACPTALLEPLMRVREAEPQIRHRPVVGSDTDWTVVSFHTVPAEELIEEKQDENSQDGTKQMKYLEK
jgi:hypothetical protein